MNSLPNPYLAKLLWSNWYYDGMLGGIADLYYDPETKTKTDIPQRVYIHCRNLYMYPEVVPDEDGLPDDARKYAEEAKGNMNEMIEFPTTTPFGTVTTGTLEYVVETDNTEDPLDAHFYLTKAREYDVHVLPDDVLEKETEKQQDFRDMVGWHDDYTQPRAEPARDVNENYKPYTGNSRMTEFYKIKREHVKLWEYPKLPLVLSTAEILMKRG